MDGWIDGWMGGWVGRKGEYTMSLSRQVVGRHMLPKWRSGKESACQCRRHRDADLTPGWEDLLEEEMVNCSSILVWKISWTEELGGL